MHKVGYAVRWRDRKRPLWMLGLIAPGCALLPSQLVLHTGQPVFWWAGPIVVFGLIPSLDALVGEDGENPPEDSYADLARDRYYRWCTYLFLPVQFAGLLVAGFLWTNGELSILDQLGLALSVGLASGIGINAAHELGHRVEKHERLLAKIGLTQSFYGHFFVEHNRGHHVRVATPEDPASARFGEPLWAFLPRSVLGGLRSGWALERERLRRKNLPVFGPANQILQAWAMSLALFGGMVAVFGIGVLPWLILQAVVAVVLLETVNYVEHYGLLRQRTASGRYERCRPEHSWNSDRLVTNIFLFHLQRHSDHHANPGRRYQTLRSFDSAPQLPAGYATMVLLAFVPPLWRHVMNPRVLAHYGGDVTRTNLGPRRRAKLLAVPPAPVAGLPEQPAA